MGLTDNFINDLVQKVSTQIIDDNKMLVSGLDQSTAVRCRIERRIRDVIVETENATWNRTFQELIERDKFETTNSDTANDSSSTDA